VRTRPRALLPLTVTAALLVGLGAATVAWLGRNPFADGYQNEYLHVGNAFDLWDALRARDLWHLRYYVAHAYWPPLFYAAPWPLLALLGRGRDALVLANLAWLGLALWAVHGLAERRSAGAVGMVLLGLSPGVFGTLVRYEPCVAQVACLGWALLALHRSRGFARPGWSLACGLAVATGMLTDRLGVVPFLALPALLALLPEPAPAAPAARLRVPPASAVVLPEPPRWRLPWKGLLLAALPVLLLAGPWYAQWFAHQAAEVGSQLAAGEIDSAGAHTEPTRGRRWAWYALVLLDSQAGPVLGGWMALAAAQALAARLRTFGAWRRPGAAGLALAAVVSGGFLFTLVQKKQVFYTMPLLLPLAVLGGGLVARLGALRAPAVFLLAGAGLAQFAARTWGLGHPALATLAGPDPLPAAWVQPRHTVARPPTGAVFPSAALAEILPDPRGHLVVYSDRPAWYEGFLSLRLRELYPGVPIHGVRGDPAGSYEWFRVADGFLYVGAGAAWPTGEAIETALREDHYDLSAVPPVAELIAEQRGRWDPAADWTLGDGAHAVLWVRR